MPLSLPIAVLKPPPDEGWRGRVLRRFWDTLEQVELTPRSLAELDHRNRISNAHGEPEEPAAQVVQEPIRIHSLQRFARNGGPDLGSIRKLLDEEDAACVSYDTIPEHHHNHPFTCKDAEMEIALGDIGAAMPQQGLQPANMASILSAMRQNGFLSIHDFTRDLSEFMDNNRGSRTQDIILSQITRHVTGELRREASTNVRFDASCHISQALVLQMCPFFCDGYNGEISAIGDALLDDVLEPLLIPSTEPGAPQAPNFFFLVDGQPRGGRVEVTRQACLAGSSGARAMGILESYVVDTLGCETACSAGEASAFTVALAHGILDVYAHHSDADNRIHMSMLGSYDMQKLGSHSFLAGAYAALTVARLAEECRRVRMEEVMHFTFGEAAY
ncbi:hypothetical protein B0I35DRAFT_474043 [Stachybotrys elegans]|uniref:Uncharacterized protein n=1 Tax=Stachybotrys elegans TaxID=80388 RepID=A0A8K0T3E2_9HYPO|nr:hypothetical protein B0I35DRAFT_474043 [Stachybotrys elegans]